MSSVSSVPSVAGRAVDAILDEVGSAPENLIAILQAIQRRFRYLPPEALRRVAELTGITLARIAGVATFYAQFRLRPAGEHTIHVCVGTACHVKGANVVFDAVRRHLAVPDGDDTDPDRRYTIERVGCLGCCMLAPVIRIDNVTYGHVSAGGIPGVLEDFEALVRERRRPGEETAAVRPETAEGEIRVCLCSSCEAAGSRQLYDALLQAVRRTGTLVRVRNVGCTGMSYFAPFVEVVLPGEEPKLYKGVSREDAEALVLRHFSPRSLGDRAWLWARGLVDRLLTDEAWEPLKRCIVEMRDPPIEIFHGRQKHIATEGIWEADPLDLEEYRRRGGFGALARCVQELAPEEVIELLRESGLRGRGGAGFGTARKMEAVRASSFAKATEDSALRSSEGAKGGAAGGERKYVVCNGDEGDPGAFMDRMLLESCPYRVIEGVAIAARTVGAREGVLYVRAEYPVAVRRVREALSACRENGILGEHVLGSDCSLDLRVVEGAGAFVCGEETALLASLEGRRGMPRLKPPYPASQGLFGMPTLVNNVETCAVIPWIIRHGPEAFSAIGTKTSRGTKVFALAGKVARGGLVEVPMGVTIREIVDEIGGGVPDGHTLKAVQIGGPSGGCVPATLADTPIDYEALSSVGAIMGSGGIVVLDETDCMVDIARYFLEFTQAESCGRCTPCRVGTKAMLDILTSLCAGEGKRGDIERIESLARMVRKTSLCGLGQTAPNPVLSTLTYFREEYEAHIEGRCPAGRCPALIRYTITDRCIGCTLCAQGCPTDAIPMTSYERHVIDDEKCVRCGTCKSVCQQDAVEVK